MTREWLFGSLFLGGFECSTHLTVEGHRLDVIASTQHDRFAVEDYALCRAAGIRAVRESARWPIFDTGGELDLAEIRRLARAGRESGVIQIWDLMHYGYPDDLDPLQAPEPFIERLACFAREVARVVCTESEGPFYFTAINEMSYNAWSAGEVGYMAPFGRGQGAEYKRILVRAALAAIEAAWTVDPNAIPVTVEPLVHLHAPPGRPDLQPQADHFNNATVPEVFDLLSGRLEPELGGSRERLGIVGLNYYSGNQWTIPVPGEPQRSLIPGDAGWVPLSTLLQRIEGRYGGPLIIAETGASGEARPEWIDFLATETEHALEAGVDLQGICLYPIVTSPDWEDPTAFFDGGAFDLSPQADGTLKRLPAMEVLESLGRAQKRLDPANRSEYELNHESAHARKPSNATAVVGRGLHDLRFKSDNFAFQTLLAGENLTLERYCIGPYGALPDHRHERTEHVLTVLSGNVRVNLGGDVAYLTTGDSVIVPAGVYHSLKNEAADEAVVQQVTSPKLWDSRFGAPHPSMLLANPGADAR